MLYAFWWKSSRNWAIKCYAKYILSKCLGWKQFHLITFPFAFIPFDASTFLPPWQDVRSPDTTPNATPTAITATKTPMQKNACNLSYIWIVMRCVYTCSTTIYTPNMWCMCCYFGSFVLLPTYIVCTRMCAVSCRVHSMQSHWITMEFVVVSIASTKNVKHSDSVLHTQRSTEWHKVRFFCVANSLHLIKIYQR